MICLNLDHWVKLLGKVGEAIFEGETMKKLRPQRFGNIFIFIDVKCKVNLVGKNYSMPRASKFKGMK